MRKTYNRQMCELSIASTELSQRFDLFVTPSKWAERCAKLEDLKSREAAGDGEQGGQEKNNEESAFLTENLELRAEAQRLQEERDEMQQMQACLADVPASLGGVSLTYRVMQICFPLFCLCGFLWAVLGSVSEQEPGKQLEEELVRIQAHAQLTEQRLSAGIGLLLCTTAIATVYARNQKTQNRELAAEKQALTQEMRGVVKHKLAQELEELLRRLQLPTVLRNIVGPTLQWGKLEIHLLNGQKAQQDVSEQLQQEISRRLALESELQTLKDELQTLKHASEQLQQEISLRLALESELQTLKDELQTLKDASEQLQQEISRRLALESELQTLKDELQTLKHASEQLQQEISRRLALESELQTLKDELQTLKDASEQLQQEISRRLALERELQTLKDACQTLKDVSEQLQQEISRRLALERELQTLKDERRRDFNRRRASVEQFPKNDGSYFDFIAGPLTHCCLCGKRSIGNGVYWRSRENNNSSFCTECIGGAGSNSDGCCAAVKNRQEV